MLLLEEHSYAMVWYLNCAKSYSEQNQMPDKIVEKMRKMLKTTVLEWATDDETEKRCSCFFTVHELSLLAWFISQAFLIRFGWRRNFGLLVVAKDSESLSLKWKEVKKYKTERNCIYSQCDSKWTTYMSSRFLQASEGMYLSSSGKHLVNVHFELPRGWNTLLSNRPIKSAQKRILLFWLHIHFIVTFIRICTFAVVWIKHVHKPEELYTV